MLSLDNDGTLFLGNLFPLIKSVHVGQNLLTLVVLCGLLQPKHRCSFFARLRSRIVIAWKDKLF